MTDVFASWSGGKDSCLACYLAGRSGLKVCYLANMVTADGRRSRSHGLAAEVLRLQAQAIGIPLVQRRATRANYEAEFKKMVLSLKKKGITGGVFGDIDFNEHREWIDRVCREVDITPNLPLWLQDQSQIMSDFIGLGFKAIVVSARADIFGEEILGQKIDHDFVRRLAEMSKTKEITPCGEAGEYHTLVIDGPLFQQRVEVLETKKVMRNGRYFLKILSADLKAK